MKRWNSISMLLICVLFLALGTACGGTSAEPLPPPEDKPQPTGVSTLTFAENECSDYINWYGRNERNATFRAMICYNSAAGFEVTFWGTQLTMSYISEINVKNFLDGSCYLCVQIDGSEDYEAGFTELPFASNQKEITLVSGLAEGKHTIEVRRATEDMCASWEIYSLKTDGFFLAPSEKPVRKIEIYGDSISAGRGNMRAVGEKENDNSNQENALMTYGAVAARSLNAQYNIFAVSGSCVGSYSTNVGANIIPKLYTKYAPTANARSKWDFAAYVPDVVIIDLGTNDIIGNSEKQEGFAEKLKSEYTAFVQNLKTKYPDATIVLCSGTFHYSRMNIQAYNALFEEIAKSFEQGARVCHLALDKSDNAHPTASENKNYGAALTEFIRSVTGWE